MVKQHMGQNHRPRCRTAAGPFAAMAILAFSAPCLVAQAKPEAPHPEWTGQYRIVRNAAELGDLKPISPDLDPVVMAHLQPWARMKAEATDGVAEDTGAVCQPDGLFRYPTAQASTFLWLPTPEKIVMVYGPQQIVTTGVERIYLNRTRHPANLLPPGTAIPSGIGKATRWWWIRSASTASPGCRSGWNRTRKRRI